MKIDRKNTNILVGKRLREERINKKISIAEIAGVLGITEEHYRKLEAGSTGISTDKLLILYDTYGTDPTYLITGVNSNRMEFNLDYFAANSSKEQRDQFFDRVLAYISELIKNG